MGIINKINEKSGIIVGAIAIALILFILGNDIFSNNPVLNVFGNKVAKMNGNSINTREVDEIMKTKEYEYRISYQKEPGENERYMLDEQVWNELLNRYVFQPEYEKIGLTITDEELTELTQGSMIHNIVQQAFGSQDFSKEKVKTFLKQLDEAEDSEQKEMYLNRWAMVLREVKLARLKEKYINLLKKSEYVTNEEAKRYYKEQNDKAELRFLYVPYTSINDTLIKNITDDEMEAYLSKNKEKHKVQDLRFVDLVVLKYTPSADDSLNTMTSLANLKEAFRKAEVDSVFIKENSDNPSNPRWYSIHELPDPVKEKSSLLKKDSIIGPVLYGTRYALFKVIDVKQDPKDTVYALRASHILFRTDVDKEQARKNALKVLDSIKRGADFADMARKHGTDGTKERGGDLGWFTNTGQMVKPFEKACFDFRGKGLLPNLVETQFGYHIIKITEEKTNKKFNIAVVEKDILISENTKDLLYNKISGVYAQSKDTSAFKKAIEKEKLEFYPNNPVEKNARSISVVPEAREIVKWAYNEAEINDVSQIYNIEDKYVIAILKGIREEGYARLNDVRSDIKARVMNEKKGDMILEKLNKLSGPLDKMATDYGQDAIYSVASDITFSSGSISSIGYDPGAVGVLFSLKENKRSKAFKGENGVVILELVKITPAPEVADYNQYKTQKEMSRSGSTDYYAMEALKKLADIKDWRYKYY
ncbi:MAG: peptidylprolyl isomerase [Cytophagaceae bacterium]|nr:peptidylprolyl isomerase [Cytophagaceae bacterium]MDW8456170.1 peptidylprolyl isomerase [Cytophagaceae bacterium]